MQLVRGVREAGLLKQGILLSVDKRVGRAVQRVVAEKTQCKRPANSLVLDGQVPDGRANVAKRPGDVAVVHVSRKVAACRDARGDGREAHEEGIGALVAQQEGEKLLLAVDEPLGKSLRSVLAKDVMRYQRGHARAPRKWCAGAASAGPGTDGY